MKVSSIEKGGFFIYKNAPHLVIERTFVSPGKGSAFARLRLKNVITGIIEKDVVLKTNETVEEADVLERKCQFLYLEDKGGDSELHFMDEQNFDQFIIPLKDQKEKYPYINEGEIFNIVFYDENPIDIILPKKKAVIVIEAPEALKGDTATSVTKIVTCQKGLKVKTPGFIKEGENILVNTETNEYVERVN